jgi:hypothetical protein
MPPKLLLRLAFSYFKNLTLRQNIGITSACR